MWSSWMTTVSALFIVAASAQEGRSTRNQAPPETKPFEAVQPKQDKAATSSAGSEGDSPDSLEHGGSWSFSDREAQKSKVNGEKGQGQAKAPRLASPKRPITAAGQYQGMRLGQKAVSPVPTPKDAKGAPVLHWVGFQRTSASSSAVFIQVDQNVKYEITKAKNRLQIHLPGVKVKYKNHRRSLDLRYFPQTPVRRVQTKLRRGETLVQIALSKQSAPKFRVQKVDQGHSRIIVEFDNP